MANVFMSTTHQKKAQLDDITDGCHIYRVKICKPLNNDSLTSVLCGVAKRNSIDFDRIAQMEQLI